MKTIQDVKIEFNGKIEPLKQNAAPPTKKKKNLQKVEQKTQMKVSPIDCIKLKSIKTKTNSGGK